VVKLPKFSELWDKYPSNEYDMYPCRNKDTGEPNFSSQCAIRLSTTMEKCGFDFSSFNGVKCWFGCDEIHVLRVVELALFLEARIGEPKKFHHIDFEGFRKVTKGASGIIAFYDFWGPGNQGDHIDLFDKYELKNGFDDYFERSRKVLFWKLDD